MKAQTVSDILLREKYPLISWKKQIPNNTL